MTAWPTERDAMLNMIERFGDGTFACVMDSYDYVGAVATWCSGQTQAIPWRRWCRCTPLAASRCWRLCRCRVGGA
jgi:hypothetical protein